MKKILITAMACLWAAMAFANHWTPNSNFESNMTVTAVVQINGVEQGSEDLELGVFCGEECRGSQRPIYIQALNRYVYFTQVYGSPSDVFLFKLFDHSQGEELDLVSPAAIAFNENGYGSLSNPHILNFTATVVISYTVTANADPVEGGSIEGAGTYANAQACSLVATPNEGYAFLNWTENGNVVSTSECYSFVVIANRNLVAHFVPNDSHWLVNDDYEYDMTLTGVVRINGVEQRAESLELGVFCGEECRGAQRPTYIERLDRYVYFTHVFGLESDSFTFKLYDHSSGAVLNLVSPEAISFNAGGVGSLARPQVLDFTGPVFQIDVEANYDEGGTVKGAGLYNQGTTATLTATPNEGYSFVNWIKDGEVVSTNPSITFTVDASATYQVNYFQETPVYNVTAIANPTIGGTVRGGGAFEQGQSCTLTATAKTGYTFINWTKNGVKISTEPSYTFVVNETATYVANFSLNSYDITVNVNLEEGGVVAGSGTYSHGTTATLTATANEGYSFVNWTRNGSVVSYNSSYSFTVTGSASYVANFTLNRYQITAIADPADGNTVTGAGTYYHGDTVILHAVAMEGYAFRNWTENGTVVSTSENYSFMVVANRDLVAHFVTSDCHWFANKDYEYDMTLTGVVQINGVEQRSGDLELGVFCGNECRGAQKPTYITVLDRYVYFTQVYGSESDVFTFKLYDHALGMELDLVSPEAIPFEIDGYGTLANPKVLNFRSPVTQQVTLSTGWNWFSSYIDLGDPVALLDMLKDALDDNALEIQSYDDNTECMDGEWFGGLDDIGIDNAQTYMILAANDCTIEMEGPVTDPANYPITLHRGWNWIGFPCSQEVSVADAFAGFEPEEGDVLQSYDNMTEFDGEDWWGELETLVPGQGLMYYSMSDEPKELVFQTGSGRAGLTNGTVSGHDYDLHYKVVSKGCASLYTTLTGVLTVNGLEQRNGALEIGVFDQYGICRAAKLPMYRSKTDQWIYQLQIKGMEGAEYTFKVFDHESGTELDLVPDMEKVVYDTRAPFGSLDDPYLFAFVSTTGIGEEVEVVNLYPNPADKEERVRMELPSSMVPVGAKVEVYDALGKLITTDTVNGSDVELEGMKVSGLYTVKVTDRKGNVCYGKLVVK